MSTYYLDRNNAIELTLQQNGATVTANTVTRALLWLPASASVAGTEVTFDSTADADTTLIESATKVQIKGGARALNPGRYTAYLTLFDAVNTDGLAWTTVPLKVEQWRPDV